MNTTLLTKYSNIIEAEYKQNGAESTYKSNMSFLRTINEALASFIFEEVTHSDIKTIITLWQQSGKSNKTVCNYLTVMRKIFRLATSDGLFNVNPMDEINNPVTPKSVIQAKATKEIVPFTLPEIQKIELAETDCIGGKMLTKFMIQNGLRPCEGVVVNLESFDFEASTYLVDLSKPLLEYKCPKTEMSRRVVTLNKELCAEIQAYIKTLGDLETYEIEVVLADNRTKIKRMFTPIFINEKIGKHYKHTKDFDQSFFSSFLKQNDIAKRGVVQCRKTFASMAISNGLSLKWVANELGHSTTQIIERHYAKWVPTSEISPEDKLRQCFTATISHQSSPPNTLDIASTQKLQWFKKLGNSISSLLGRAV